MLTPRRNVWPPPPPTAESEQEKVARIEAEREAKRVSNAIDDALASELEILLSRPGRIGQIDDFKELPAPFAPKAFQAEAEAWRPVIHLNLVRSVNFIMGLLEIRHPSTYNNSNGQLSSPESSMSGELRRLSISLAPLRQVEESLSNRIAGSRPPDEASEYNPAKASEISLRSGSGWTAFLRFRRGSSSNDQYDKLGEMQNRRILAACASDIMAMWSSREVQQGLNDREITLQEQSGFFLNDVHRICADNYTPTPDDILRARVHTVGPEEHVIHMESTIESMKTWTVYDMGGSTSQRVAWAQFFDDVHVIIFLAPISAFNETLAENHAVNRLADSLKLWRTICSNKLLLSVEFILFLNKVDILMRKIQSGVVFAEHVTSFRNKPNEPKEVIKYLSDAFATINHTYSPRKRKMHRHVTCAIDTKATSVVINDIREVILLNALTSTNIL
ncbi:guanine nucleotide binding protein, alpha subunit [Mycena rebaudengoi]|nr:guanine nucleotide binding protein, alpha subunit [Mycena rebaudengoi]